LNVLNLFLNLLDQQLHLKADLGELNLNGFCPKRIGLAMQFLAKEVEPLSFRLGALAF
jgi:hypothetical protein